MTANKNELRNSIAELAQMNVSLNKKGGPSRSKKLFQQILIQEQEILKYFELPNTPYNQGLLRFNSIPWDKEIDDLISILHKEKEVQINKNAVNDIDILIEAKKSNRDPMFILPQLGIETHVYTLFVYNNILMFGQDEPVNILNELKLANNYEILNITGRMHSTVDWLEKSEDTIKSLEQRGLKYIREYADEIKKQLNSWGKI